MSPRSTPASRRTRNQYQGKAGEDSPAVFMHMSIHLTPRLQAIADCVPPGARVIDVGTDHARIPVWLAQENRVCHVWASDLRPGPLCGAAALVAETGSDAVVSLRMTDGLNGFSSRDGDTVILAGMGGETIVSILSAAPWTRENIELILSPHTKQAELRAFLCENGYEITRESLVRDAGRIYPLFTAQGGVPAAYSTAELHLGLFSQIGPDPLFGEYISQQKKRVAGAAPYDPASAALLLDFEKLEERWKICRS